MRLGVIVGVFTVAIGWTLNKFNVPALCVLVVLIVIFVLIVKKSKEFGKMKKTLFNLSLCKEAVSYDENYILEK